MPTIVFTNLNFTEEQAKDAHNYAMANIKEFIPNEYEKYNLLLRRYASANIKTNKEKWRYDLE